MTATCVWLLSRFQATGPGRAPSSLPTCRKSSQHRSENQVKLPSMQIGDSAARQELGRQLVTANKAGTKPGALF